MRSFHLQLILGIAALWTMIAGCEVSNKTTDAGSDGNRDMDGGRDAAVIADAAGDGAKPGSPVSLASCLTDLGEAIELPGESFLVCNPDEPRPGGENRCLGDCAALGRNLQHWTPVWKPSDCAACTQESSCEDFTECFRGCAPDVTTDGGVTPSTDCVDCFTELWICTETQCKGCKNEEITSECAECLAKKGCSDQFLDCTGFSFEACLVCD